MAVSTARASGLETGVRWLARAVSVVVLLLGGLFISVEFIGGGPHDWAQIVPMIVWLGALPAAWFWELTAGIVVVVAFGVHVLVNPSMLGSAFGLALVSGLLFVLAGWLSREPAR